MMLERSGLFVRMVLFVGGYVHGLHWDCIGIVDCTRIAKMRSCSGALPCVSVAFVSLLWLSRLILPLF